MAENSAELLVDLSVALTAGWLASTSVDCLVDWKVHHWAVLMVVLSVDWMVVKWVVK